MVLVAAKASVRANVGVVSECGTGQGVIIITGLEGRKIRKRKGEGRRGERRGSRLKQGWEREIYDGEKNNRQEERLLLAVAVRVQSRA